MVDPNSQPELRVLTELRADLPEPDPARLARVERRLRAAYTATPKRPGRGVAILALAAGLTAAAIAAGTAVGYIRTDGHAQQRGATGLTTAAEKSGGISFRFHLTTTNSTQHPEGFADERGEWDPAGPRANLNFYDQQGRLSTEIRLDGPDCWTRSPGQNWAWVGIGSPTAARQKFLRAPFLGLDRDGNAVSANPTLEPADLLRQLLAHNARIVDRGLTGDEHTYEWSLRLPDLQGQPNVENGTVVVDAAGRIGKLVWIEPGLEPEAPARVTVYTTTVVYSDYGLQFDVRHP
jgi:hypothetical protein